MMIINPLIAVSFFKIILFHIKIIVYLYHIFLKDKILEIQDLKIQKGLALQDILTELHLLCNQSQY